MPSPSGYPGGLKERNWRIIVACLKRDSMKGLAGAMSNLGLKDPGERWPERGCPIPVPCPEEGTPLPHGDFNTPVPGLGDPVMGGDKEVLFPMITDLNAFLIYTPRDKHLHNPIGTS